LIFINPLSVFYKLICFATLSKLLHLPHNQTKYYLILKIEVMNVDQIMNGLEKKHPGEVEYLQAVREVLESIEDVVNENPQFEAAGLIDRIVEPDRILTFKVPWVGDDGKVNVNLGYRIQFNNAIGPYKGGLRFHPSVNLSILKFLGFEQIFKNSLTTLPLGGGKGGSDFDPKGKSDNEVMRFAQSFMMELHSLIGPETDVPAGDIGVGGREIGFLYGMYKKLRKENTGILTGKGLTWGGSLVRPEATGFGNVYFAKEMLATKGETFEGKRVAISGFGNVAWGAALKVTELGGKVVTISGPDGYIYDEAGISGEKIDYMLELRASNNDIVKPYATEFPEAKFFAGKRPWEQKVDVALPCATQNELNEDDAKSLIENGCMCVGEGATMPCTPEALAVFLEHKILFSPGKASNAGGVATSGLEMSQNAQKLSWTAKEVDDKLHQIMRDIHEQCVKYGTEENGYVNYMKGANIAGFLKVAHAMMDQGII
jgi:glutamate dehydrogenase (NADP+)